MMVMTVPWHWLGPRGPVAPRRAFRLCRSGDRGMGAMGRCLGRRRRHPAGKRGALHWNLARLPWRRNRSRSDPLPPQRYALAVHPPARVPATLNGFALWNVVVFVLMLTAYGYPIAQSFILPAAAGECASRQRSGLSRMDTLDRTWRLRVIAMLVGMLAVVGGAWLHRRSRDRGADSTPGSTPSPRSAARSASISARAAPAAPAAGAPASKRCLDRARVRGARSSGQGRGRSRGASDLHRVPCRRRHRRADPAIPRMAGQSAFAIYKELQDFKSGARANDMMSQIVQSLDDEADGGCRRLLREPAAQRTSTRRIRALPARRSRRLVLRGDSRRALPPCAACHMPRRRAVRSRRRASPANPPPMSTAQLKAFAEGNRHNDVYQRMRAIAAKLTPREMTLARRLLHDAALMRRPRRRGAIARLGSPARCARASPASRHASRRIPTAHRPRH